VPWTCQKARQSAGQQPVEEIVELKMEAVEIIVPIVRPWSQPSDEFARRAVLALPRPGVPMGLRFQRPVLLGVDGERDCAAECG